MRPARTSTWWSKTYLKQLRTRLFGPRLLRDKAFVKRHYSDKGTRDIDGYFGDRQRKCVVDGRIVACPSRIARDHYLSLIQSEITSCNAKRVLEVGCGTSLNLFLLSQALPGVAFEGIDLTPERIETGRSWFSANKGYVPQAIVGDVTDLAFADDAFDLVFSVHCFEQLDRFSVAGVREVLRVADKKAVFLEPDSRSSNPAQRLFLRNHNYLFDFDRTLERLAPGRLRHRSLDTYINPLNRTGLFVVDTAGWRTQSLS